MTTSSSKQYSDLLEEYSELVSTKEECLVNNELICECFLISAAQIRELVSKNDSKIEPNLLPDFCYQESDLGHGCGSCIKNQDDWKFKIIKTRD